MFEGNYWTIDYRSGQAEFKPPLDHARFVNRSSGDLPIVAVFFKEEVVKRMDNITANISELPEPAIISFYPQEQKNIIDFLVSFRVPHYPIFKVAKSLKLERILEKDIYEMNFLFSSVGEAHIVDEKFFSVFHSDWQECSVTFLDACFDNEKIKDRPLTLLPATVNIVPATNEFVRM